MNRKSRPSSTQTRPAGEQPRVTCFDCMRPQQYCYCHLMPQIDNKTTVIIAQHIRERAHPFNTARMVANALTNSQLVTDYLENFRQHSHLLRPGTALLYPSKHATDISELTSDQIPSQLLLIDGTWDQAKRLYRQWPELKDLQHLKLSPQQPGRYRIRLEPSDTSLSTVEATVAALRILEPETGSLDKLVSVFDSMVEGQLAHPSARYDAGLVPKKPTLNIPRKLLSEKHRIVVAYGEAAPISKGSPKHHVRRPVYWVAQRMIDGEKFSCPIECESPVDQGLLNYFQLQPSDFQDAVTADKFKAMWQQFSRPDDILVVYNVGSLRLLRAVGIDPGHWLSVHAINYDTNNQFKTLREFLSANAWPVEPVDFPGRSGQRLANLRSLVMYLQAQLFKSQQQGD